MSQPTSLTCSTRDSFRFKNSCISQDVFFDRTQSSEERVKQSEFIIMSSTSTSFPPAPQAKFKSSNRMFWACVFILMLASLHSFEVKSFVSWLMDVKPATTTSSPSTTRTTTSTTTTTTKSSNSTSRATTTSTVQEILRVIPIKTNALVNETTRKVTSKTAAATDAADHNTIINRTKAVVVARKRNKIIDMQQEKQQPQIDSTSHRPPSHVHNITMVQEMGCCTSIGDGHKCRNTCFTDRACGDHADSFYPYASTAEEKWFNTMDVVNRSVHEQKHEQQRVCDEYMDRDPAAPPKWCQQSSSMLLSTATATKNNKSSNNKNHNRSTMNLTSIPTHCSGMGARSGPFDRTFLIPQGKLVFCGIPKVGITQWRKFSRFMFGAVDYQSNPHFKADASKFSFAHLSRSRQEEVLNDPSWTKAIFLRDPAERLMSAYLDKVEKKMLKIKLSWQSSPNDIDLKSIPSSTKASVFADWVRSLETEPAVSCQGRRGPSWCWDPHWRPQVYSCGIRELLPYFDFVGSLSQAANHTKALLEKVNLWQDYGAKYLVSSHNIRLPICNALPPNPNQDKDVFRGGFQQNVLAKNDRHTKDSHSKMDRYFTTEIWNIVKRLYKEDYDLWNALNQDKSRSWAHGSILSARLNPQCRQERTTTTTTKR